MLLGVGHSAVDGDVVLGLSWDFFLECLPGGCEALGLGLLSIAGVVVLFCWVDFCVP